MPNYAAIGHQVSATEILVFEILNHRKTTYLHFQRVHPNTLSDLHHEQAPLMRGFFSLACCPSQQLSISHHAPLSFLVKRHFTSYCCVCFLCFVGNEWSIHTFKCLPSSLRIETPNDESVNNIEDHEDDVSLLANIFQCWRRNLYNEEIPKKSRGCCKGNSFRSSFEGQNFRRISPNRCHPS